MIMQALIFDCDGVLVDTERDGHRVAFNRAFEHFGLTARWDPELYGRLLKIGGGKERMKHYFATCSAPQDASITEAFIKKLHEVKTQFFMDIIERGELSPRPGVLRLIDEALAADIPVAVCSTSNERAVALIVERLIGVERRHGFAGIFAGDVVKHKKPDPAVYLLALQKLSLRAADCVVIEDSEIGLRAAKAAGIRCVITKNAYTAAEDFSGADGVFDELGDPPNVNVTIKDLMAMVQGGQE